MDTGCLRELGFTPAQVKVYLALLELGTSTTGPVIWQSGLQNSVVYHALNQLIQRGLVSFVIKGKVRYFSATDPAVLVNYVEEKKVQVTHLAQELKKKRNSPSKQEAAFFVGWRAVFTAFDTILDELPRGSDYIGFAAGMEEQFNEETRAFFRRFQKKRAAMGYDVRLIANDVARAQVLSYRHSKKSRLEFRFVPGFAPIGLIIFGDRVLQASFGDSPMAVIITSPQLAQSYRKFFEAMWKVAKP